MVENFDWNVKIMEDGYSKAELYYTCNPLYIGSFIELSGNSAAITTTINMAHNPPLKGRENDRVSGEESYVKNFAKHTSGRIYLDSSTTQLVLKAIEIPGSQVIDLKSLVLTKVTE